MSFERTSPLPPAEPAPTPGPAEAAAAGAVTAEVTPAMRLQILSTEHWSLLASRNLAWNESFSRAGIMSVIAATPWLVSTLNALLTGAIGALLTMQLGADAWPAIIVGAIVFVLALAFVSLYERRQIRKLMGAHRPMFPAPRPPSAPPPEV